MEDLIPESRGNFLSVFAGQLTRAAKSKESGTSVLSVSFWKPFWKGAEPLWGTEVYIAPQTCYEGQMSRDDRGEKLFVKKVIDCPFLTLQKFCGIQALHDTHDSIPGYHHCASPHTGTSPELGTLHSPAGDRHGWCRSPPQFPCPPAGAEVRGTGGTVKDTGNYR